MNANFAVSRSHAAAGSIKTNAPLSFVFDILREWIKNNPVTMSNIKDGSPARVLLAKPQIHTVDLSHNRLADTAMLTNIKLVRYQQNPTAHWGPQAKAGGA